MRYFFILILLINYACVPSADLTRCYYKVYIEDAMIPHCSNPGSPMIELDWHYGSYQMVDSILSYTTDGYIMRNNTNPKMTVYTENICNKITVEFYVNNSLMSTKSTELGYQSNCIELCTEGYTRTLNFMYP